VIQIVLGEQISRTEVLVPLAEWITVAYLPNLRPEQIIKNGRIPVLLSQLKQPTAQIDYW
jgi:hypothetical protein